MKIDLRRPIFVLVIATATLPIKAQDDSSDDNKDDNNSGSIAGGIIGVIFFFAVLGVVIYLLWRHKKKNEEFCICQNSDEEDSESEDSRAIPPPPDNRESINRWSQFAREVQPQIQNYPQPENFVRQNSSKFDIAKFENASNCKEYSISQQKTCSICLGDFCVGEYLTKTKCDHLFHIPCLKEWAKKAEHLTCPVCRKDIIVQV